MEENFEGEDLDNIVILNDEEGNEVKCVTKKKNLILLLDLV